MNTAHATVAPSGPVEMLPNVDLLIAEGSANTLGLGGLRAVDGRAFPLQRVKVRGSLAGPCARVVVDQHFANPFPETLDVTWIFPLPSDAAIVELEIRCGDVVVKGECQERAAAQAAFNAARSEGKRAALVEKELGDVHTLSLAGIPAGSDITVSLTLVQLLPSIDGRFRWHFPTTIAPRYTPGTETGYDGFGAQADTNAVPNASRLSAPIRIAGGTELDLEVEIAGPLTALESSLHAVKMRLESGVTRVAPSARATMNKDFILEFSTAESTSLSTRAYTDGTHTLVLVEPPSATDTPALPRDAVFAVDISGSMESLKMEAAKTALLGALHGLHTGDRFKLIAFDDRVERFSAEFSAYTDKNLTAADRWIAGLEARGGTEMLPAIQESLDGATPAGRLRTVLLITDGQSNDEARLLPAVANRKGDALFFTLGIDTAVNGALLKSLARAGGGVCELCTPHDNIDSVVARLESRFGSPLLSHLTVKGAARPDGQTVFAGRPASVLLDSAPEMLTVTATGVAGAFEARVAPTRISFPLGALWAMERVAWLEERLMLRPFEEEAIRPEILRVALQWHISSKFTAFVGVDHSTVTSGERRHVVQPTELPESWEAPSQGSQMLPAPPQSAPMPAMAAYRRVSMPSAQSLGGQSNHASAPMADTDDIQLMSPARFSPALKSAKIRDSIGHLLGLQKKVAVEDFAGVLARSQGADGSFGGDIGRTAAALLVLLMSGNTSRKGDRRRTVQKAAQWLRQHADDERARTALAALESAELSPLMPNTVWRSFAGDGVEGRMLAQLMDARGA